MAVVAISDSILTDIADAIRSKNGQETLYKPSQMPDAIEAISGGGITPTGTIEITQNGVVDVTNYASADVDVPTGSTPVINSLSVTENGTYTAPTGVDGYSPITVNVSSESALYPLENGSKTFSDGTVVTVTNGNHVKVTIPSGHTSNGYIALSDISENTNNLDTASNVQNHASKFSIGAGKHAIYLIYNATLAGSCSFNVYGTGTSNLDMPISALTSNYGEAIKTFSSSADVGCLFFVGKTPGTYEFDVRFLVDGVKYV